MRFRACCTSVRRKAPMNFIFLGLFTAAQSFLLGTAASSFQREEVRKIQILFYYKIYIFVPI